MPELQSIRVIIKPLISTETLMEHLDHAKLTPGNSNNYLNLCIFCPGIIHLTGFESK